MVELDGNINVVIEGNKKVIVTGAKGSQGVPGDNAPTRKFLIFGFKYHEGFGQQQVNEYVNNTEETFDIQYNSGVGCITITSPSNGDLIRNTPVIVDITLQGDVENNFPHYQHLYDEPNSSLNLWNIMSISDGFSGFTKETRIVIEFLTNHTYTL